MGGGGGGGGEQILHTLYIGGHLTVSRFIILQLFKTSYSRDNSSKYDENLKRLNLNRFSIWYCHIIIHLLFLASHAVSKIHYIWNSCEIWYS